MLLGRVMPQKNNARNGSTQRGPTLGERQEATKTLLMLLASMDTGWIFNANDELWREEAACRSDATLINLFFGEYQDDDNHYKETGRHERIAKAKALCESCSVKQDCLDWALQHQPSAYQQQGIYGGKTGTERRLILKKRKHDRLHDVA